MDGFIHKRRKREPKAKNGVVKLNSELFSGSISVIGRQRVMEDAVKVVHEFVSVAGNPYDFFGVYDGHGGARVASACKERMHALLEKEVVVVEKEGGGVVVEWEKVMRSCFWKMDEEVRTGGGGCGGGAKVEMVGSTAVVVVVGKEEVVVANCGDSRAVLCRGGVAVPLSRDHKPDRADEMERVEAAGGRILNWNGSRVLGVLATSRSIGDHYLRPYVISEPEVTVTERTELDDFLVIASDGLWDVVSNEFACEVVRRCLDGQIKRRISEVSSESTAGDAAAILAELAMSRGSNDNISVIVVALKK
ncbi:hypothetical protein RGQ29_010755 [Quercus rubra]|uniref:protein-serine/threonine phosphatase n=1 Tax=Quercus rubra TaxID=3512 RepID=A0AAN7G2F2_QUERU|nr:hypothetical protein RGQ29_010755 [Quercus rubra]